MFVAFNMCCQLHMDDKLLACVTSVVMCYKITSVYALIR